MLERIVYVSRCAPGVTDQDVYDIIRTSHNRNSQRGLTGGLLFIDQHFVQVLEGDRYFVRERYQSIATDIRHAHVELRQTVRPQTLIFPGEWMALRSGHEIPPAIKAQFGYEPGLPAERFSAERVVNFVLACCTQPALAPMVSETGSATGSAMR